MGEGALRPRRGGAPSLFSCVWVQGRGNFSKAVGPPRWARSRRAPNRRSRSAARGLRGRAGRRGRAAAAAAGGGPGAARQEDGGGVGGPEGRPEPVWGFPRESADGDSVSRVSTARRGELLGGALGPLCLLRVYQ